MAALDGSDRPVNRGLQRRWREGENSFFARSFAEPGMYEASVKLVRGLADGLGDLTSEPQLQEGYGERGEECAEARLSEMDLEIRNWPDLDLALDAAFNMRLNELRTEIAAKATIRRLAAAREAGETWLTSLDDEIGFPGQRTYRRVDIHTHAGVALYGYSTRDLDSDEEFFLEVLQVDSETGERVRGAPPLRQPHDYPNREALARAFVRARQRYAGGQ